MGCHKPAIKPAATHYVFADLSRSFPLGTDMTVAQKAGSYVRQSLLTHAVIGDAITLQAVGRRSVANAMATTITTTPQFRVPAAAETVANIIATLPHGKDSQQEATSLLFTLENANIACQPSSQIVIISDSIDKSRDGGNFADILAGNGDLADSTSAMFKGCTSITFLGFGLTTDETAQLDSVEFARLKAAWLRFAVNAGAKPEHVKFVTTF